VRPKVWLSDRLTASTGQREPCFPIRPGGHAVAVRNGHRAITQSDQALGSICPTPSTSSGIPRLRVQSPATTATRTGFLSSPAAISRVTLEAKCVFVGCQERGPWIDRAREYQNVAVLDSAGVLDLSWGTPNWRRATARVPGICPTRGPVKTSAVLAGTRTPQSQFIVRTGRTCRSSGAER
jgi:hypothetical protein